MDDIRLTPLEHDFLKLLTPFWTRFVLTDTVRRLGCSLDEFNEAARALLEQGLIEGQEYEHYVLMRAIPREVPAPPETTEPAPEPEAAATIKEVDEPDEADEVDEVDETGDFDELGEVEEVDYPDDRPTQPTLF